MSPETCKCTMCVADRAEAELWRRRAVIANAIYVWFGRLSILTCLIMIIVGLIDASAP